MATLSLQFKGKTFHRYSLKNGVSLLIGRQNSNDVVIDNAAVSETHARIFSKAGEFYIEDQAISFSSKGL